ncbi:MAG: hypothetical protein AAB588_05910 [Patescibacteria group bacterium]
MSHINTVKNIAAALIIIFMSACADELNTGTSATNEPSASGPNISENTNIAKPKEERQPETALNEPGVTANRITTVKGEVPTPAPLNEPYQPQADSTIFQTPELGALVKVEEGTTIEEWRAPEPTYESPPEIISHPLASVIFVRTSGKEYKLVVLPKEPNETLEEWSRHSNFGDPYLPDDTVQTKNNFTAYVYKTGDEGALPLHHVMIATERFVYRFDWEDPRLPQDGDEAMEFIRNDREAYFNTPQDLLDFIQEIEVQ